MLIFLVTLHAASAFFYGFGINALLPAIIAVLTTTMLDLAIHYIKIKTLIVPYSGIITGLFIGGLLAQNLEWHVYVSAGIIAILSKHFMRKRQRHIFNPANFGVLIVSIIFGAAHSWWITSPVILMLLFGLFVIWKLKKIELALAFLISYFVISIITNFGIMPNLNQIYLFIINSGIILFFSMFMLIEPKTTPMGKKQRVIYGIFVAALLVVFNKTIPIHDLPLALAVGNIFVPLLNRSNMAKPAS